MAARPCVVEVTPRPNYDEYLASDAWQRRRERYILTQDYACFRCHATRGKRLQLHHLTYARLGAELDSDLCWLCPVCHMFTHWRIDELAPIERLPVTAEQVEAIGAATKKARLRIVLRDIESRFPELPSNEAYAIAVAYVYGGAS